jgi:hypothetical protein
MGFVRYYWKVFRAAFSHSLSIAQSVIFALAIAIGAIAYFIPKTQAILMPWASILNGWQVATGVLGAIVFVRLALAPYWMFIQQSGRIDDLTRHVSIPDLVIDARRVPEIFDNPDDNAVVHIIIRDFHLTNRSDFSASIEIRLKFTMAGMTLYPDQDDAPLGLVEAVKELDPSIGRHLGRRIPLPTHEGVTGYLCYRIFDPITRAMATAISMTTADFLRTLEQKIEIRDHVSGITKSISFKALGPYSFRELEA